MKSRVKIEAKRGPDENEFKRHMSSKENEQREVRKYYIHENPFFCLISLIAQCLAEGLQISKF